jgi:hypothetical protein
MSFYYDVTAAMDSHELELPPQQAWILVSFEFPVVTGGGRFLLMIHPYYGDYNSKINNGEGILYPPFVAYPVELGYFRKRNLGAIREKIDSVARDVIFNSRNLVDQYAYNLGLGSPNSELVEKLEEFKSSPREHSVGKFFRLYRYRCWHTEAKGKRDISDPEGLKGHCFVPLGTDNKAGFEGEAGGPHTYRYLSKPLATQFGKISAQYLGEAGTEKFTSLDRDDLVNVENGYVIWMDLSGYGNFNVYSRQTPSALRSGSELAVEYRFHVASIFEEFFSVVGTSQHRINGDGFLCGLPMRNFGSAEAAMKAVAKGIELLGQKIMQINSNVDEPNFSIGIRLCVQPGDYVYGKVGGLRALRADFDGEAVITAARTDKAIADNFGSKERRTLVTIASTDCGCLSLIKEQLSDSFEMNKLISTVKESKYNIHILTKTI